MSEGWITGILLTTHTMWKGLFEGMIRMQGSDSKVYDYLANEVFNLQEADVQHFLLATSILKEINPLLCDQFLGVTDSRQTLRLLEDKNLFISRLERGEERWYRYHHLFREFLLTKLREEHPEQVRTLQQRAARLLHESGATEQAIEHYLVVEDHENAVQSILEIARETYDAGRLATMARWIDALPTEMVCGCAQLVWYRAKVHLELGELEKAMPLFDRAYVEFARGEDRLGQAQTLVEKSVVLRMQGNLREALDACERAISLLQGMEPDDEVQWVVASAHRLLGTAQGQLGNLAQGEAELRQALSMYQQLGRTTSIARVHNDLGVILQMAGNLAGAELHFREALEIWDRLGNVGLAALTINNIAIGHHYRGEYSQALELYALGLNQARKAGLERTMAFILAGVGDVYRDQAAYEESLRAYEEGLEAARQSRENFIICYLLDAIGNIHRLMGNPNLAIDFVRQAYDRAVERDTTYEISLYRTSLGVIHYQQGNIRLAEEHLTQARDFFQHSNAQRELAKASLYLAQTYYVAGRFQEALECVQLVLNCLPELGYDQFLIPVAREARRVIEYAVEKGLEDTLIRHLLDQLDALSTAGSQAAIPPANATVQPLLRAYAFGEGRVLSGDRLISSADWGMAKSKELLFYLLCHKQRRKDQIGEALWPELSPAKLRSSFHVALYRLRRALDQQDCVKYEDDQYFFNRRINYWFDVEEFEQHIRDGKLAWSTDRAQSAYHFRQAAVLYGGEFLEGLTSSHEWCLVKRGELLQAYLLALQRLAEHHAILEEYEPAIHYYERVLERDSYQESAYREIMRCQALMGERSSALQTYHQLAEVLENELGVAPAPDTTTVYEQILQGRILPR
jgi:ATP/maltotriose-dependent transcriptional regulator MalT/DNA-binding SARP family transcriptional activator